MIAVPKLPRPARPCRSCITIAFSTHQSGERGGDDLQCANGSVVVQQGHKRSVSDQIVDASLSNDRGSVGSRLLETGVLGEVCMEDVNVGAVSQLGRDLFLGRHFVADQTNY